MNFKVLLLPICIIAGVASLECVFEVKDPNDQLNIHGGVDTCQSGDDYCIKINSVRIYAKGCSTTAPKITYNNVDTRCTAEGCSDNGFQCCCKGNKCNGAVKVSVIMPLGMVVLGVATAFV